MKSTANSQNTNSTQTKPGIVFETDLIARPKSLQPKNRPRIKGPSWYQKAWTKISSVFKSNKDLHAKRMPSKNWLKISYRIYLGVGIGILILLFALSNYYVTTSVKIGGLDYINTKPVQVEIQNLVKNTPLLKVDNETIRAYLINKYPFIKDVYVEKSIFQGYMVKVQQHDLLMSVKIDDKRYYFTQEGLLVGFLPINKAMNDATVQISRDNLDLIQTNLFKGNEAINLFKAEGYFGRNVFDNFGNLSILTLDNKEIIVDLNEEFFSIDEQIKVLQNESIKNTFASINFRSPKVIVKLKE